MGGDTFFDGVYFVEGVDVSDMTLDEALAHWEENEIEPVHAARTVAFRRHEDRLVGRRLYQQLPSGIADGV